MWWKWTRRIPARPNTVIFCRNAMQLCFDYLSRCDQKVDYSLVLRGYSCTNTSVVLHSQKAISTYLWSKQILAPGFAEQCRALTWSVWQPTNNHVKINGPVLLVFLYQPSRLCRIPDQKKTQQTRDVTPCIGSMPRHRLPSGLAAQNSEVLGSSVCHRESCAYTGLQTVQMPGVYSAAYAIAHYK